MTPLPGITGSLFPSRFLLEGLTIGDSGTFVVSPADEARRQLQFWWRGVENTCGPATSVRTIFDVVAMPLAGLLGFRARDAAFERARVRARLTTRRGGHVGLIVLPWAARPSRLWRDLTETARSSGSSWCLIVAPPFLSIVEARGHALRRSVDFEFPQALDGRSFAAFWTLCHAGAFLPGVMNGRAGTCVLDVLVSRATVFQDAVRRDLQAGVMSAFGAIGPILRNRPGQSPIDRFSEALTLVYRILFLFFAEARALVPVQHSGYSDAYALTMLARAQRREPFEVAGLWEALAAVTRLSRGGCEFPDLIVRPFNGRLFARTAAPVLEVPQRGGKPTAKSRSRDAALATALTCLSSRPGKSGREDISYTDLGVEQLGAVYERILDLDPDEVITRQAPAVHPGRRDRHSQQRKETGTFYTPQVLAEYVVRRALAPLVAGAAPDDILKLRVVDPAMGSGAFLVAACRFLAHAYERALLHEGRVAETDLDEEERAKIRRLVAGRCLCGVDANPTAVQLARLSLWLTTLARDKPLTFLDDRLRVGNSLVGASPDDLWRVAGRRASGVSRGTPLFDAAGLEAAIRVLAQPLRELREHPDDTVADVKAKERRWLEITGESSPLEKWRLACSLWCARWFWPKNRSKAPSSAETAAVLDALLRGDTTLTVEHLQSWIGTTRMVSQEHGFFHWPLEFAADFYEDTGEPRPTAGFDAVIGNPPWEVLRKDHGEKAGADRQANTLAFIRGSGLFPSCDRGHLNLYQPFLERSISITRPGGRVGLVLPWGMATDDGSARLRTRLLEQTGIDSIAGFDNAEALFPIHRGVRFMVLVTSPGAAARDVRARFGLRRAAEVDDLPGEDESGDRSSFPFRLSAATIRDVGGPTRRIPDVRQPEDLEWLCRISQRFPRIGSAAGWQASFGRELNATEDRDRFGRRGLPVIDGKHIGPFAVQSETQRRIPEEDARQLIPDRRFTRPRLGYRDVSSATNRYALIAAIIPAGVVTTHTLFSLRTAIPIEQQYFLCGLFNSAALNAFVRMLMGGHVTTSLIESLPIPVWTGSADQLRIAELTTHLLQNPSDTARLEELNSRAAQIYC